MRARDMVAEGEHPLLGRMNMPGLPVKSSAELTATRHPAPCLGQHSASTLAAPGLDQAELEWLVADDLIHDSRRAEATKLRSRRT